MRSLLGLGLLVLLAARLHAAPVSFDLRQPRARLLVEGFVGEQSAVLIVDTGSPFHAVTAGFAARAHLAPGEAHVFTDALGRERTGHDVSTKLELDGLPRILDTVMISDWMKGAHADGLVSPQRLVDGAHALVLDLPRATMTEVPLADAFGSRPRKRLLADVAVAEDGHFRAPVHIGDRDLVMTIDTGAPASALYAPRDASLPADSVEHSAVRARVQVGEVRREVMLDEIVPATPAADDGLVGLDVLRDCTLSISRARLRVTCDDVVDLGVAVSPQPMPRTSLCLGDDGPCLRPLVEGGWTYAGDRLDARIDDHGKVTFLEKSGRSLSMRSTDEERRWLMDATGAMRDQLDRDADMRSSFAYLPRLLARVWGRQGQSTAQRRELLFRIWNECAEPDDQDRGMAGARARRVIDAFVRRVAPPGSHDAYAREELEQLNRRRGSGKRFDPYSADRDLFGSAD